MSKALPALAAISAFLAIGFGAFGAHAIQDPKAQEWIRTAVLFQLPHAVAVFSLLGWRNGGPIRAGAGALLAGSLIFSFSLYLLALGAPRALAMFAPVGGMVMLLGWLWIAGCALRSRA